MERDVRNAMSDSELTIAFVAVCECYRRKLERLAVKRTRSPQMAEEIAQDVLFALHVYLKVSVQHRRWLDVQTWLYDTARRWLPRPHQMREPGSDSQRRENYPTDRALFLAYQRGYRLDEICWQRRSDSLTSAVDPDALLNRSEAARVQSKRNKSSADQPVVYAVTDILESFPDSLRRTAQLHFLEECSNATIAETLGCPVNTVRSYVHRATVLLRERLMVLV